MFNIDKIEPFCFWENSKIGFHIVMNGKLYAIDLSLDEAKQVLSRLHQAISSYEDLERLVEQHEPKEEKE